MSGYPQTPNREWLQHVAMTLSFWPCGLECVKLNQNGDVMLEFCDIINPYESGAISRTIASRIGYRFAHMKLQRIKRGDWEMARASVSGTVNP